MASNKALTVVEDVESVVVVGDFVVVVDFVVV
jgi:hypothetical protein